jgi:hypothetical protein
MAMPWYRGVGALLLGTIVAGAGPAYGQITVAAIPAARSISTPLTESDRGKQYLNELFCPFSFIESAVSAGFGQWRDRPPEWRQGAAGYGRRFASSFAQHATQETLKFGLASLLHEDNRYVLSGQTKFVPRLLYALESTFQSRDDDGLRQVSYSNIGSLAGASLISRTWQPRSTGGAGNGAVNFGIAIAFSAGLNVGREFFHR